MADELKSPQRVDGPTPNGGVYAIAYVHDDGSIEIVEFDGQDREIMRVYGTLKHDKPGLGSFG